MLFRPPLAKAFPVPRKTTSMFSWECPIIDRRSGGALAVGADELGLPLGRGGHLPAALALAAVGVEEQGPLFFQQTAEVAAELLHVSRGEIAAVLEGIVLGAPTFRYRDLDPASFSVVDVPAALDPDLDGHSSTSFRLPVR